MSCTNRHTGGHIDAGSFGTQGGASDGAPMKVPRLRSGPACIATNVAVAAHGEPERHAVLRLGSTWDGSGI